MTLCLLEVFSIDFVYAHVLDMYFKKHLSQLSTIEEGQAKKVFQGDIKKIQALKDNTISSYIVSRFSQDKANLQGFSNRTTEKGSLSNN